MGKHLNLSQRIIIEDKLNKNISLRKIGECIVKPHTTISREILSRRVLVKGNNFNNFNIKCNKVKTAPFACNACSNKNKSKKNRYFYYAKDANDEQIQLMMNHINKTRRKKLDGNTPFDLLINQIGLENLKKLGFYYIPPKDIILKPSLLKMHNK